MTDLRIDLLGGFRVVVGDRAVDPKTWSQRKPAALVKLLALAPGHRLRREQAMDALWPELDPSAAAANLRKALHSARRSLGDGVGAELILSAGDLLVLAPDGLSVDVDEYWALASAARRSREPAAYGLPVELCGSGLLPEDRYEDWAVATREELQADWLALVEELASLLEARCELNDAARAVQRLVAAEPLREDYHAWLMRLYTLAGRLDEARRQYGRLCEVLADELGAEPGPQTQRLFAEISTHQTAEPDLAGDLWERVGDLRVQSGDPAGGVKAFAQALGTATARESVARIHQKLAGAWLMQHQADEAEQHLLIAERLTPTQAELGRLACLRANLAWERGDLAEARTRAEQAYDIATADGDTDDVATALEALAFIGHIQGTWWPGLQGQIESLASMSLGLRVGRFCDFNHCLGQYQLYGDALADSVEGYARQTLTIAERADALPAQAFAWCLLGETFLLRALWDEADACLARSCELYAPLGSRSVALPWLRRAELAACVGAHDDASAYLNRASAIAAVTPMARHAWARLHATAAFAAMERGEPERVIRAVRSTSTAAARYGDCPTCSALLNPVGAQAFALVGDTAGADLLAESAAQLAASFKSSAWSAMAESAAASAAVAGGDQVTARQRFESAAGLYRQAGHSFWADRADAQVKTLSAAITTGERSGNA